MIKLCSGLYRATWILRIAKATCCRLRSRNSKLKGTPAPKSHVGTLSMTRWEAKLRNNLDRRREILGFLAWGRWTSKTASTGFLGRPSIIGTRGKERLYSFQSSGILIPCSQQGLNLRRSNQGRGSALNTRSSEILSPRKSHPWGLKPPIHTNSKRKSWERASKLRNKASLTSTSPQI